MKPFRVSTRTGDGSLEHQFFDTRLEAECAAEQIAQGGFFSTVTKIFAEDNVDSAWNYLCEYAPKAVQS